MNSKITNQYPTPSEHTRGVNTCEYIIHHHTGTKEGTTKGVLDGLNKRADYASCHYLINELWEVYKMWNDTDILWHAGTSSWAGKTNLNNYSIGIEIIGPLSDGGFTDIQREKFAELVKDLCKIHNIPKENILRHKDISPGRKVDVADTFWNRDFKNYRAYIDSIFPWEYRTLFGKSVISNPERLAKAIQSGSADECVAALEIIAERVTKKVLKEQGLI